MYNKNSYKNSRYDDVETYYGDITAFAWDNDKFLFITNPEAWEKKGINKLEEEVERLFNLKSKEKLTSINSFGDFYDNKTDLCAWASPEGLDLDLIPGLSKMALTVIGLKEQDLKECSASVFCDFGDGDVSIKAAFYPSEGLQEALEERSEISTSELSFELTMKFDDSGDNTLHVLLRSLLTITDNFIDINDLDNLENDLFRGLGGFGMEDVYDDYRDYGESSGSASGYGYEASGSAEAYDYDDYE